MQINNQFGNYDSHIIENKRADGNVNIDVARQQKNPMDVSGWKEGMVFKGEVLDIVDNKVLLRLENQLNFMARLQSDMELGIGDQLLFSVKENNGNQVFIKPMFDSLYSAQTQVLEKALDMAGLSPTEKNFAVAKELMEAGLPLDRASMTNLLSQSMKFPDTPISTLVSLNKLNIPVTQENILQFVKYENGQHQFAADIGNAITSMTDFVNAFPSKEQSDVLISFAKEMVEYFTDSLDTSMPSAEGEVVTETVTSPEIATNQTDSVPEASPSDLQDTTPLEQKTDDEPVQYLTKETVLNEKEATAFMKEMEQMGISKDMVSSVIKNSSSPETFLQNVLKTMEQVMPDSESVHTWLGSESFKKLFADLVNKNWGLDPKQMKSPKEIDDLYERIQKQSKHFEEAISAKGGDTKGFQQSFQNMKQNMSFMEQLNHQMIYAQMPLRLSNQNANSELYVYADKRKLMQKKDGVSVMLHLDMDHLGQTDVKIDLKGSHVNARFYFNDQESVNLVSGHMEELATRLKERGFSLTDEVVKRQPQESINKVIDEVIDENAEKSIKRYTFDARM